MTYTARWMKAVLTAVLTSALVVVIGFAAQARAADLPLAAASPLTGVAFDDRPLLLPVQRNFQMAMLTASSELGRSCGSMEAYGWRMNQAEQGRVNQIFNNTVDRLRLLGYTIAPQILTSVSNDITLFTADRADKHFLFLWSAGELGLVLNLCATSAPLVSTSHPTNLVPSVQVFPVPTDVVPSHLDALSKTGARASGAFTPAGEWIGGYTCQQGYTGGTLKIGPLHGKDFEGVFKFYPTPKNPKVPAGAYAVYGQYDAESNRVLINPGKWIERPRDFYNTIIVGGFDPARDTFSAYFQGIAGCTSFEATREDNFNGSVSPVKKQKKHVVKKKKTVKNPLVTRQTKVNPPAIEMEPALVAPTQAEPSVVPPAVPAPVVAPAPSAPVPAAAPAPNPFLTPAPAASPISGGK
jgi:hypothetical protein